MQKREREGPAWKPTSHRIHNSSHNALGDDGIPSTQPSASHELSFSSLTTPHNKDEYCYYFLYFIYEKTGAQKVK